jgi:hypothetical protein
MGETVIVTVTDSSSFYLTQGFHQPVPAKKPDKDYVVNIKIYPNPVKKADGKIKVQFFVRDVDDFTLTVTDILGKLVWNSRVFDVYSGQIEEIDLGSVPQGIYFVHVFSQKEEMKKTEKIVKL